MRIIPLTFGCKRDWDLMFLLRQTLSKYSPCNHHLFIDKLEFTPQEITELEKSFTVQVREPEVWGNGAGWYSAMMKFAAVKHVTVMEQVADDDFIMCVDSDTFFVTGKIFDALTDDGLQGLQHQPLYETDLGWMAHMSGACTFIRGNILKKIVNITKEELLDIRQDFQNRVLCENEDIVLSYLAYYCGATAKCIDSDLTSCDSFEKLFYDLDYRSKHSFIHLNYEMDVMLGEKVTGKWDIPNLLKKLNIEI